MDRFLLKSTGYRVIMTDNLDDDEPVFPLVPAQVGALIAFAVALILIWHAVRDSG